MQCTPTILEFFWSAAEKSGEIENILGRRAREDCEKLLEFLTALNCSPLGAILINNCLIKIIVEKRKKKKEDEVGLVLVYTGISFFNVSSSRILSRFNF